MLRSLSQWINAQWKRLLTLEAAPHAIARGTAVGIIVGFSPLYSIKTALALILAWICRGSKLAAVILVTLHDVLIPLEPFFLRWQYRMGHYLLSSPHEWPPALEMTHVVGHWQDWLKPEMLLGVIWPTLVGSLVMSLPLAAIGYWLIYRLVDPTSKAPASPRP